MPPPVKKHMVGNKTILQSYLDNLTSPEEGAEIPEDDLADGDVQYFVDNEGRYYYQPAGDQSLLPVLAETEVSAVNPLKGANDQAHQTVTLVPSENDQGEVSYVLVVQEENQPVLNIEIKNEQADAGDGEESEGDDDVYQFDEEKAEEEAEEETEQDKAPKSPKSKKKRAGRRRPDFTCSFCSYTSDRRYLVIRHMRSHSEERPHKCDVCERGFKTQAALHNHVNMHNGIKPHFCKFCQSTFTTSGELVRHVRYKHTHEKPHRCTECDYASVELSKLRRHVRCHTGERPYQCQHCTYASPDTFKLKRHMRTHTGEKPYKCTDCNMAFTQSNSLKTHRLIHNVGDKAVYACELCPAKCGRKTDLRMHMQKLHSASDIPLPCKRCGKSFTDRYSYKMHNKTHEGEKCFKCKLCPYASMTLPHLKSHMLKHMDEKPFACTECDQSFRQKQLLQRHVNLYHNPHYVKKPPREKTHSCRECSRTFAHKGNLIRHLAIHDPDSGHREHALALKLGRQKRIKIINGKMTVISDPSASDEVIKLGTTKRELKRGELVTVTDGDDQQYVVLEVIQLDDGTEQQVAVVAPEFEEENSEVQELEDEVEDEAEMDEDNDPMIEENPLETAENAQKGLVEKTIELKSEINTCFGFDVEI